MPTVDQPYTNFSLPNNLVSIIDEFLKKNRAGFRSRAEVIATAVREYLERRGINLGVEPPAKKS